MNNTDKPAEAAGILSALVGIEKSAPAYSVLGVSLGRLDRSQEAEAAYRAALEVEPDYEEAMFNLAGLLHEDDPTQSEELLRNALRIDPDYAEAHRFLGSLLLRRGYTEEAETHFRRATELDPSC